MSESQQTVFVKSPKHSPTDVSKKSNVQLAQLLYEQTQLNDELQLKLDDLQSRLSRSERLLHDLGIVSDAQGRLQHLENAESGYDKEKERIKSTLIAYEERVRVAEKERDAALARRGTIEDGWFKVREWIHGQQQQQAETLNSFSKLVQTGHGDLRLGASPVFHHPPHQPPYAQHGQILSSPVSSRAIPPGQPRHSVHALPSQHMPQRPGSGHGLRPPPSHPYPPGQGPAGQSSYASRPRSDSSSRIEPSEKYRRTTGEYPPPPSHHPQQHPSQSQHRPPPPQDPRGPPSHPHLTEHRRRRSGSHESVDVDEMILQTTSASPRNPYPGAVAANAASHNGAAKKRGYDDYGEGRGPVPNPSDGPIRSAGGGSGGYSESGKRRRMFSGSDIDITTAGHAYQQAPPSAGVGSAQVMTSPQTATSMAPPSAGVGVPTATPSQVTINGQVIQAYPSMNPEGQRICRQCGMPGRYKEGKCVEKWGPGPLGPGTVCDRCRKRMRRVERRGTLEENRPQHPPGLVHPQQQHLAAAKDKHREPHVPHHASTLPSNLPSTTSPPLHDDHRNGVSRAGTLPAIPFPSSSGSLALQQKDERRVVSTSHSRRTSPLLASHPTEPSHLRPLTVTHHPSPPSKASAVGAGEESMEVDQDADGEEDADADGEVDGEIDAEIAGTIGEPVHALGRGPPPHRSRSRSIPLPVGGGGGGGLGASGDGGVIETASPLPESTSDEVLPPVVDTLSLAPPPRSHSSMSHRSNGSVKSPIGQTLAPPPSDIVVFEQKKEQEEDGEISMIMDDADAEFLDAVEAAEERSSGKRDSD